VAPLSSSFDDACFVFSFVNPLFWSTNHRHVGIEYLPIVVGGDYLQVVNTLNKVEPNWNIYELIAKDAKGYLLIVVVGKYVILKRRLITRHTVLLRRLLNNGRIRFR
jgi:hypothetical protein